MELCLMLCGILDRRGVWEYFLPLCFKNLWILSAFPWGGTCFRLRNGAYIHQPILCTPLL